MTSYFIKEICKILSGKLLCFQEDAMIENVFIDSRSHVTFSNSLFFALKGKRNNGHEFIQELYEKGVRNFVVSDEIDIQSLPKANIIQVKNSLTALQYLAAQHRKKFNYPIIGITGSNGKTVVKEWLFQLLYNNYHIVRSPKSFNSQVGVPLSVLLMNQNHSLGIFETGISMPNEMEKLEQILSPEIGILTNIRDAHQENFKSRKEKIVEKLVLFKNTNTIIYGKEDKEIEAELNSSHYNEKKLFSWSRKDKDASLFITDIHKEDNQTTLKGKYKDENQTITIPFIDDASVENAITCWLTLLVLEVGASIISTNFQELQPVAMRLELKSGINNCILINDSYNSDISSLQIALNYLNQQSSGMEKVVILSDIFQSGSKPKELYQKVNELLIQNNVNKLIGIGSALFQNQQVIDIKKEFYPSTKDFLTKINLPSFKNKAILIKGARTFKFEKINTRLEQKIHDTVLEINMNHLISNLNYFKSLLLPDTKIMVMVKAVSYGFGTYEIANILQYNKVDYLAVAYTDEGIELRKAGIKLPIMVMNPEIESFNLMIRHQLEPEIYSLRSLSAFIKSVKQNALFIESGSYPIHLKIDTGMHRLGFEKNEIGELISLIKKAPFIKIESVFSHLVATDEAEHDNFTNEQITLFKQLANSICTQFNYPINKHILNSNGITRFNDAQFDMVRLGIGIYGVSSEKNTQEKLLPVSTLKTRISQLKIVKKGDTIGYGRKGVAEKETTTATVAIGYADGLHRSLGNGKWNMLVNGKKAPIIGNVCMDMTILDVTGISCKEGDEVTVFGPDNPITKMAAISNTIPYEILTSVSTRVKRLFYYE